MPPEEPIRIKSHLNHEARERNTSTVKLPDHVDAKFRNLVSSDFAATSDYASDFIARVPSPLLYQRAERSDAAVPTPLVDYRPPSPLLYHAQKDTSETRHTTHTDSGSKSTTTISACRVPGIEPELSAPGAPVSAMVSHTFVAARLPLMGEALNWDVGSSAPKPAVDHPAKRTFNGFLSNQPRRKLPVVSRKSRASQHHVASTGSLNVSESPRLLSKLSQSHEKQNSSHCPASSTLEEVDPVPPQQGIRGCRVTQAMTKTENLSFPDFAERGKHDLPSPERSCSQLSTAVVRDTCPQILETKDPSRLSTVTTADKEKSNAVNDDLGRVYCIGQELVRARIKEVVDWVITDMNLHQPSRSAGLDKGPLSFAQEREPDGPSGVSASPRESGPDADDWVDDQHVEVGADWDSDWMWEVGEENDAEWEASLEDFDEQEMEHIGLVVFGF